MGRSPRPDADPAATAGHETGRRAVVVGTVLAAGLIGVILGARYPAADCAGAHVGSHDLGWGISVLLLPMLVGALGGVVIGSTANAAAGCMATLLFAVVFAATTMLVAQVVVDPAGCHETLADDIMVATAITLIGGLPGWGIGRLAALGMAAHRSRSRPDG